MNRRSAATLMEVLVAIFIMAIGLLAILALFPLGAVRMAEAIQSDRSAQLAQSATALAEAFDLRNDPAITAFSVKPGGNANINPRVPVSGGPGYPVYVDGIGALNGGTAYVGGNTAGTRAIRRVAPTGITSTVLALKAFALLDDIRFGNTGLPVATTTTAVDRESTLTFALMYRRPLMNSSLAEFAVVVYNRRPISAAVGETEYAGIGVVTFNTADNSILINAAGRAIPKLSPGTWILDATLVDQKAGIANAKPTAYSYFYRVVSVSQPAANQYQIEVGTPLRGWNPGWTAAQMQARGVTPCLIVMDNVVEVFEKGTGWPQ